MTGSKGLLPTDLACLLDVFGHYCYVLDMYSTHVGACKEVHHVVFNSFLDWFDGIHLELEVISPCAWEFCIHGVRKDPYIPDWYLVFLGYTSRPPVMKPFYWWWASHVPPLLWRLVDLVLPQWPSGPVSLWGMIKETFLWLSVASAASSSSQASWGRETSSTGLPRVSLSFWLSGNEATSHWNPWWAFPKFAWLWFKWLPFVFDMIQKMAEEFDKIQWVLEREVRDFEEGLKRQIGTIFCSATT